MWCPRCDQGDIAKAVIRKTGQIIFVCQECEATWFSSEDIKVTRFVDFGTYMKSIGLSSHWGELDVGKSALGEE